MQAIETNNNIIGYTLNAANRLLSSGGSSGGEAALIAMGGSIIGLGSDLGASIRLPAAFNGIVGLRPSNGRLPYLGVANSVSFSFLFCNFWSWLINADVDNLRSDARP